MKLWTTRIGIVALSGLSLVALGCEQFETSEAPPGEGTAPLIEEAGDASPHADKHRKGKMSKRGKGGPGAMLIKKALHDLELTDEQRETIEGLAESCKPDDAGKSAHVEFRDALAAGVRAGALDDALIDEKLAALETQGAAKHAKMLENLNTLHATLTPAQRAELVEGIRAKAERRGDKSDKSGKSGMRGKKDRDGKRGKFGKKGEKGMFAMVRGLDLSEEQSTQLREAMRPEAKPSGEDMKTKMSAKREKMKAMMTAFASDDFDATALASEADGGRMRKMIERKVEMVRTLIDIVDDAQREKLAANLEKDWKSKKRGKRGKRDMRDGKRDMRDGNPGLRRDRGARVQ